MIRLTAKHDWLDNLPTRRLSAQRTRPRAPKGKARACDQQDTGLCSFSEMNHITTRARVAQTSTNSKALTESDIVHQFCRAMREEDIHVSAADLMADGKLHRIRAEGDREKTVWYVLHADDRPAGMFGCNRRYGHDTKFTWKAAIERAPLTAAEKRAYRERMERIEAQRAAEDAAARAAASERANRLWSEAVDCEEHPYLERKGVLAHGLRVGRWEVINQDTGEVRTVTDQALLIPMRDLQKHIHSLQAIMPQKREGASDKWYLTDGDKEGNFWVIGRPLEHDGKQVIIICEGYATGASIHEATGHAVIIAFDAPNLLPVAKVWRARFPDAIIIIAADNDQWTLKPVVNPGLTRARECGAEVGALVAFPPFDAALGATNERGGRAHGPTDFNDLQQLEGREAICGVIDAVLNPSPAVADARADENASPSQIVLVPTEDEALGADHACECLVRLGGQLREWETAAGVSDAADAVGRSAELRGTLFVPYDQFGLELAAKAAAHIFPGVELHILAAPGDEVKAQRVGQRYGALVSQPDCGDDWRGWGEHFLDMLFSRIDAKADTDPAAREFAEQAIGQARVDNDGETGPAHNGYFTILGLDHGKYFIFRHNTGQVAAITKGDMTDAGLIELAPLNWWEANFAGSERSGGIDRKAAINFIVRTAEERGIYDPSHIRGRGAWSDEGRAIYHHGGYLSVDGVRKDVAEIESDYVYERTYSLPEPHDTGLTTAEGDALLRLMCRFRWSMPASALLFGGWIALAPVCGALPWRPHLWITGGAGSGKSTIAKMAHDLLRGTDVFAQGSSTEPGIRQRLKGDARPVLMDESESIEEGDAKRIQSILSLIRQASTESDAETLKGTADGSGMTYHIRSMFCLASIQVALKNKADIDRLSVLTLRSGRDAKSDPNEWKSLKDTIHSLVGHDPTVSRRLLRRTIDLLPTTLQNIDVFTEVGARVFGSQRDGDQYGTLLAGAWSMISNDVASRAQAEEMIKGYDWSEHLEAAEEDDSQRALNAMLGAFVRMDTGETSTLSDLISVGAGRYDGGDDIRLKDAKKKLGQLGLKVESIDGREYLFVSNENAEREKLMRDTPFKVGAKKMLMRLPGAMTGERARGRSKNKTRFPGLANPQYHFVVPLDVIFGDEVEGRARPDAVAETEMETEPF